MEYRTRFAKAVRVLHFVDCVIAAHARANGLSVATFEKGFGKLADVKVEPE